MRQFCSIENINIVPTYFLNITNSTSFFKIRGTFLIIRLASLTFLCPGITKASILSALGLAKTMLNLQPVSHISCFYVSNI